MESTIRPGLFVMAGLPGHGLDRLSRELVLEFGLCNFIIFSRNVGHGRDALAGLLKELRRICRRAGLPEPLFAVDQEGGAVQRLGPPHWPVIPSNEEVGRSSAPLEAAKAQARAAGEALRELGIVLNLAPVLDLAEKGQDPVLRGRCYGSDPRQVGRLGETYLKELQSMGVGATAKHFPGLGGVTMDPHKVLPRISDGEEGLRRRLLPFSQAVDSGVAAVMTTHCIFEGWDGAAPATFSSLIAHRLLRQELGFGGLLLTDDLDMGGARTMGPVGQAAVEAFAVGHDLLLICNSVERVAEALEDLERGLSRSRALRERASESWNRLRSFRERFPVPYSPGG